MAPELPEDYNEICVWNYARQRYSEFCDIPTHLLPLLVDDYHYYDNGDGDCGDN
jgi:hypothetical protein